MKYFPSFLTESDFTSGETKVSMVDLINIKRFNTKSIDDYLNRFRKMKSRCYKQILKHELKLVNQQLRANKGRRIEQLKFKNERNRKFDKVIRRDKMVYVELVNNEDMETNSDSDVEYKDNDVNLDKSKLGFHIKGQKYCKYHNVYGHWIYNYIKDVIQKVITKGRLKFKERQMNMDSDLFQVQANYVELVQVLTLDVTIQEEDKIMPIFPISMESLTRAIAKLEKENEEIFPQPRVSLVDFLLKNKEVDKEFFQDLQPKPSKILKFEGVIRLQNLKELSLKSRRSYGSHRNEGSSKASNPDYHGEWLES
ncbi:hypothetical protein CR513_36223, partial [Mucuna pruriens]